MQIKEKIKQVKGNISIDEELLNKYRNVKEMFDDAENILKRKRVIIRLVSIKEIEELNLENLKIESLKVVANKLFNKYHKTNIFDNKGCEICVTKNGINESIQKLYNSKNQRNFLKEHLMVFTKLGDIITDSVLVSQTLERKERAGILYWNYYLNNIYINRKFYIIEFDVRILNIGQTQYRVQRINLKQEKTSNPG